MGTFGDRSQSEGEAFRLTPAERARLPQDLDLDALQRLLALLDAQRRAWLLESLRADAALREALPHDASRSGASWPDRPPGVPAVGWTAPQPFLHEPELESMLDAVYAPRRARLRGTPDHTVPAGWPSVQEVAGPFLLVVLLTSATPVEPGAVVLRRPGRFGGDAIALTEGGRSIDLLLSAVDILMRSRSAEPSEPQEARRFFVPAGSPTPDAPPRIRKNLGFCLDSVHAAPPEIEAFPGIGRGRGFEMWLFGRPRSPPK